MEHNRTAPKEEGLDHTLGLLREGYRYILNRRIALQADVFETRLLGEAVVCMGGEEAARIFYDNDKFKRGGAAPKRVLQTLFGETGVQTLDGAEHRNRKAMFMSIMSREHLNRLNAIAEQEWEKAGNAWQAKGRIVLYREAQQLMCKVACIWAGVPLRYDEIEKRTEELARMIESSTAVGPAYWSGKRARSDAEKWIAGLIADTRRGRLRPPVGSALAVFSEHRELDGRLLDERTAAVEVLNIIRPIVAIAIYINFTALAVYQHPELRDKLAARDPRYLQMYVQEVRRFYPFFPFAGARVKEPSEWKGYSFKRDQLALLDLYGTNHDPQRWSQPDVFDPERFTDWDGNPFDFIPQGGGDHWLGHRCAGEWVTIEIMKISLDVLANRLDYRLPAQDVAYSLVDMPSIPKSEIVLERVQLR